jgi:hypothetical protein
MPEEEDIDVQTDPSPVEDVDTDPSTVDPGEPTPQEGGQDSEQSVPYDRFKEVNDERNYLREQVNALAQKPHVQQGPVSPTQEADPYAGMNAETKVFYQDLDQRAAKIASKEVQKAEERHKQLVENLQVQNARIQAKLFRQEQADVIPGSKEENEIARYISMGIPPDKAAMAVMGDKRINSAKSGKTQIQKTKAEQKAQANLETAGIPTNSGIPTGEKLSYRDDLDRRFRAAGL